MLSSDAVFHEIEPGTFVRKCTSSEAASALVSTLDGFTHMSFSADVNIKQDISRIDFNQKLWNAVVRLRHLLPGLAFSVSKLPGPEGEFQFKYVVLKSLEDVMEWYKSVVFVYDNEFAFNEAHEKVAKMRFWKASDGRYTHELHVHPNPRSKGAWTFTLSSIHCNVDAQSAWMILNQLFSFLVDEVKGSAPPLSSLQWGEEIKRLPACPELVPSIAEKGVPDDFPSLEDLSFPIPPKDMVPWYLQCASQGVPDEAVIGGKLILNEDETSRLHAACKAHGKTITQVATGLTILAMVEFAFRDAIKGGDEFFQKTLLDFNSATHFPTSMNTVNVRALLPDGYRTIDGEHSTPLSCVDGFPLSFPLSPYRKMFHIDADRKSIEKSADDDVFWTEIITGVANEWKQNDRSFEAFKNRAAINTMATAMPDLVFGYFQNSAPYLTSTGDLARLGLLKAFFPSAGNDTLTVEDIDSTSRFFMFPKTFSYIQYNGTFRVKCLTGGKYCTKEEMDSFVKVIKEWFDVVIFKFC